MHVDYKWLLNMDGCAGFKPPNKIFPRRCRNIFIDVSDVGANVKAEQ